MAPGAKMLEFDTPNFTIIYPDGYESHAHRLADLAEQMRPKVNRFLGWDPGHATLALSDTDDVPNAFAVPFPRPFALFWVASPLSAPPSETYEPEEWLREVFTHEYAHLVHLDMHGGIWRYLRKAFGPIPAFYPNAFTMPWVIEGTAVVAETALTSGGRGRSAMWDGMARTLALDGKLPPLDRIANDAFTYWPSSGNARYGLGSMILRHALDARGDEKLAALFENYGTRPIPLMVNRSSKQVLGARWSALHREWVAAATQRARAQQVEILHRGETEETRLTFDGYWKHAPVALDDGKIAYTVSTMDAHSSLVMRHPDGRVEKLRDVHGAWSLAVSPDRKRLAYHALEQHDTDWTRGAIYEFDLETRREKTLVEGERMFFPSYRPDGSLVVTRISDRAERSALCASRQGIDEAWVIRGKADFASAGIWAPNERGARRLIFDPLVASERETYLFDASVSPDGRLIACALQHRSGETDIRLFGPDQTFESDLARDRHQDRSPAFSPDGRWLIFASDRTGVWNVHAVDLTEKAEKRTLRQATNVVGGAIQPSFSPDGRTIYFCGLTSDGWEIFSQPFEPERFKGDPGPLPGSLFYVAPRAAQPEPSPATRTPVRAYEASRTLGPAFWFPFPWQGGDTFGPGVALYGIDALLQQDWLFLGGARAGRNRSDHGTGGFTFNYTDRSDRPEWSVSVSDEPMWKGGRRRGASFSAGRGWSRARYSHGVGIGWGLGRYFSVPPEPSPRGTPYPTPGPEGGIGIGWGYGDSHILGRSVSPTEGQWGSANVGLSHPYFGGAKIIEAYAAEANKFIPLPFRHHVLAIGARASRVTGVASHSLGGFGCQLPDPLPCADTVTGTYGLGPMWIRGYPPGVFRGRWAFFTRAQYGFPLLRLERGLGTLPAYVQVFHGDVFFDMGYAADHPFGEPRPRAHSSAGFELAANGNVFWAAPVKLVFGAAFRLGRPDLPQLYFRFVTGFF